MKVLSIILLRWRNGAAPLVLASEYNLAEFSFFTRGSVKEVALFVSREVVQRANGASLMSVKHKEYLCHAKITSGGLAACVLADEEYPARVAFALLQEGLDLFTKQYGATKWTEIQQDSAMTVTGLNAALLKFQKPEEADKILKIQKELDETKAVLVKSIDDLLMRGEKIEDLARKSNDLSFQSKAFVEKSEELNSCCTIL